MKHARWTTLIVVVLIALMTVTATACSSKAANQPPTITSLTADPTSLAPGDGSTVTCVANDSDGDALSYAWTCNGGAVSGTGAEVTWVAPSVAKTYTIGVTVSDGNGGTDEDTVAISVAVAPTPTPTPTPTPAPSDGSIDIKSGSMDGVKVIIDGVNTGMVTPYVATHIPAGSHTVKLVLDWYKWRIGTVTVVGGETAYINWALELATSKSVTLQPNASVGKDSYILESMPDTNEDGAWGIYADANGAGTQTKAYIQFSLSSLPGTAVITSAWLELYYDYTSAAAPASIGAYRVLGAWTESGPSSITWNNQPAINASAEYTAALPAAVTNDFVYWDITDMVGVWLGGGAITNHGVALVDTDLTTAEAWKGFSSSDNPNAAHHPKLEIYYYDPAEP